MTSVPLRQPLLDDLARHVRYTQFVRAGLSQSSSSSYLFRSTENHTEAEAGTRAEPRHARTQELTHTGLFMLPTMTRPSSLDCRRLCITPNLAARHSLDYTSWWVLGNLPKQVSIRAHRAYFFDAWKFVLSVRRHCLRQGNSNNNGRTLKHKKEFHRKMIGNWISRPRLYSFAHL